MSQQAIVQSDYLNIYLSKGWKVVNSQPSGLCNEFLLEHESSDPELRKDVARDTLPRAGEKIELPACLIPDVFKVWEKARTVEDDTRQQLGVFRVTFVHREIGLRCVLEREPK